MSLFKPSVKALNPLNRLNAIFVLAVDRIAKSPNLFNWSMISAIGLYLEAAPRAAAMCLAVLVTGHRHLRTLLGCALPRAMCSAVVPLDTS